MERIRELDVFRGLGVLYVVFFHYTTKYIQIFDKPELHSFIFPKRAYSVDFLFIISGLVLYMSICRKKSVKEFLCARFARIYPVYVCSIILTFLVLKISYIPFLGNRTLTDVLANMTMVPYLFEAKRIDGVYWFLYVEVSFYIAISVFFFLNFACHYELLFYISVLFLQAVYHILKLYFHFKIPAESYLLLSHIHLFIIGIIIYKLAIFKQNNFLYKTIILFLSLLNHFLIQKSIFNTLLILSYIILLRLALQGYMKWICKKSLQYIGIISYPLFLLHQNIGYCIIFYLEKLSIPYFLSAVIALAIIIFVAHLFTIYIEDPASKFIKSRLEMVK